MTDQVTVPPRNFGHNSSVFGDAFDLDADQKAIEEEVLETFVFEYEFLREDPLGVERGDIDATDAGHAARLLRLRYMLAELPPGTRIVQKRTESEDARWTKSAKLRFLLRLMVSHHDWLKGLGGERADLSGLDLRDVNLAKRNLSHADMNGTDLSNADLSSAVLVGANMRGVNLSGANLCGADLSGVDLTDANLCDAMLFGANLDGADLWRTNVSGCFIAPKKLHKALRCRLAKRNDG